MSCKKNIMNELVIGKIGTAYGIHGWIKMFSFTEKIENIFNYKPWFIQCSQNRKRKCLELEKWKYHNDSIIIKCKDINNRNAALKLTNCKITIDSNQLDILQNGSYYWKDLIGCNVVNLQHYKMGKVVDLIETGSNDVLVVQANEKDAFNVKKRLIPFIEPNVIKTVDIKHIMITVDWHPSF
ncbi:ribosome maturation factor RimM [Candidatus Pantoea carbekii]|uniref:ribosome maturation factor RimM n=1 Tax=Candidatus Pantoea carbekii TaxID=1235990 RepID=UPI0006187DA5|nr:ribosome maturation factor RimM [Candidatus Pantoea carbekii]AKC32433.1 16S rRNA processing protein RimM [Candidatus Pantoea carbekii]